MQIGAAELTVLEFLNDPYGVYGLARGVSMYPPGFISLPQPHPGAKTFRRLIKLVQTAEWTLDSVDLVARQLRPATLGG